MKPVFIKRYFWDIEFAKLNLKKKKSFVISRLLDKGDLKAAKWVDEFYSQEDIKSALQNSRNFSLKSASFWALVYKVPLSKVKCLQKPYQAIRRALWPY